MFLRQSTAQAVRFGPCLDKSDGVTEETALTLAQADMRLSKDGAAFSQKSASGNASHDSDGWYSTTLSTTDTNTVGELILNVHQPANMLPVWHKYWVIEEVIYDNLFGAGALGYAKGITKNAAHNDIEFLMVSASDHFSPRTGLTVSGTRSIDGGAFASVDGTIAEVANGIYQFDALAADLNGDVITFRFTATTADDRYIMVKTS